MPIDFGMVAEVNGVEVSAAKVAASGVSWQIDADTLATMPDADYLAWQAFIITRW